MPKEAAPSKATKPKKESPIPEEILGMDKSWKATFPKFEMKSCLVKVIKPKRIIEATEVNSTIIIILAETLALLIAINHASIAPKKIKISIFMCKLKKPNRLLT